MKSGEFFEVRKKGKKGRYVIHESDFDPELYEMGESSAGGSGASDITPMNAKKAAAAVGEADADNLDEMEAAENASGKPRKSVLAAIEARRKELAG